MRENIYIDETKFTIRKRMEQHKKDVEFGKKNNTLNKHVEESRRQIAWKITTYLEKKLNPMHLVHIILLKIYFIATIRMPIYLDYVC